MRKIKNNILNKLCATMVPLFLGCLVLGLSAFAQEFPNRPLKLIVPFGSGGVADVVARAYAERLSVRLGQNVLIDNRAGASGNIGTEAVARSVPDGYTLLLAFDGTMVINPHVYPKIGFDTLQDFVPISKLGNSTQILVATPSFPANTLAELIGKSKSMRGINYGTSGTASPGHVSGEMLKQMTGLDLVHVPYKGGAQAVADVLGGQIQLAFTAVATARPLIAAGKLKALGVTTSERSPQLPDVHTFVESGLKDFVVDTWIGIMAPAKTPRHIIDRLARESSAMMMVPEVRQRFLALGVVPVGNTPEQFGNQVATDLARWAKVIKDSNISLEP
jgi:tripartite-type tricarboxylate transporter receptor subunit TctC